MHPAVFLIYFISAAVILLASPTLIVQFSLPYNRAGRARVTLDFSLYSADSLHVYLFTSVCSHSVTTTAVIFRLKFSLISTVTVLVSHSVAPWLPISAASYCIFPFTFNLKAAYSIILSFTFTRFNTS